MVISNGSLIKLKIIAHEDAKCQKPVKDKEFEALINPSQFIEDLSVSYSQCQGKGTSGVQLQFDKITPANFDLELIFDATGILVKKEVFDITNPLSPPKPESVEDQIKKFKEVTMSYDGETHSTYYLKLIWGKLFFIGNLIKLKITYTLFKPDGTPLRAKANATFKQFKEDELRIIEEGKSSPDLTHVRTVKAGDTLPLMTYNIYGDFSYYLEVARVNKLKNYRQLIPGMKLIFPPLNKETA